MLTDEELRALAADLESDRVERKRVLNSSTRDKIAQTICAYANDLPAHGAPGVVLVGMNDDGTTSGLDVNDKLLLDLGGIRSDGNILPLPIVTVRKVRIGSDDVAAVVVEPHPDPPVRYEGRVWIRVGPRLATASRDDERILVERRRASDLPFDRTPVHGASVADLDGTMFAQSYLPAAVSADVLAENGRSRAEQLQALHLLARGGEPNVTAILLLGVDPGSWFPMAYVQFVRWGGSDMDAPILDQKELRGPLPQVLRDADAIARLNIRTETQIEGGSTEQRRPDYPITAIEQLLRNAVLHRSYEVQAPIYWYWFDDRIEIHSPGGLYGRVTPEVFGEMTDYRNPGVAEGLRVLGFVQRFGWGVRAARRRCAENGNPPPEFQFQPSAVLATLRRRR